MASGMQIAGMGLVEWIFQTNTGENVPLRTMAYYVPNAKVRLLSPQRLFDLDSGKGGRYFGDTLGLSINIGNQTVFGPYDAHNSLPIGYATVRDPVMISTPQVHLTLRDDAYQNLTAGQKMLLHWHQQFGHLNFPAAQRILRAAPFLTLKFALASKCDLHMLKCAICEFAKGHRCALQKFSPVQSVSDADVTAGSLMINHLKPGANVIC